VGQYDFSEQKEFFQRGVQACKASRPGFLIQGSTEHSVLMHCSWISDYIYRSSWCFSPKSTQVILLLVRAKPLGTIPKENKWNWKKKSKQERNPKRTWTAPAKTHDQIQGYQSQMHFFPLCQHSQTSDITSYLVMHKTKSWS